MPDHSKEICKICGYTFDLHYTNTTFHSYNYCPGDEGKMNWDEEPGATFEPPGIYKEKKNDLSTD